MTAHLADQICLWAAFIVPIPLIGAYRWIGVALGTVAVWGILLLAGVWISSLDPKRDAAMLDSIWLLFGWIGGLLYCLPIFGLRELVAYLVRRRRASPAGG
jgi:hypothetical protein